MKDKLLFTEDDQLEELEFNGLEDLREQFEMSGMDRIKCCICGEYFWDHFGNNPYPVVEDEDARCCNYCNSRFVIPARLRIIDRLAGAYADGVDR